MTHPCTLRITSEGTGEATCVSGEFSDDEWRLLERFLAYAEDFFTVKLLQGGEYGAVTWRWDRASGFSGDADLPSSDDLAACLHKARPLILPKEPTSFRRVRNILARRLDHPQVRDYLAEQLRIYTGQRMQSLFSIRTNDLVLNSDEGLNTWLNAYEYHRDQDKQGLFEQVQSIVPRPTLEGVFLGQLLDKAEALMGLAGLVQVVLGKHPEMGFRA